MSWPPASAPAAARQHRTRWGGRGIRDHGSATLEMAIATPFMLLIISLMVLAGRVAVAGIGAL